MRSLPEDLPIDLVRTALADGWGLRPSSLEYVPEGGGAYHWKLTAYDGNAYFVTVDDLDSKPWLGDTRAATYAGLRWALTTAAQLKEHAGLQFVVAPVMLAAPIASAAPGAPDHHDGREILRRLSDRYAVSVFPFLDGHSHPFGPYEDPRLRQAALELVAALHQATPAVKAHARQYTPSFAGRCDLEAFLANPDQQWNGGPFSDGARRLLVPRATDLAQLTARFDCLAEATEPAPADLVITHGEPHPANLRSTPSSNPTGTGAHPDSRLALVDWDTVALAAPERDVALIATADNDGLDQYQQLTGRAVNPDAIYLYRLRWYLDDLASAIRLFRNGHTDNADTQRWRHGLPLTLDPLPRWLATP